MQATLTATVQKEIRSMAIEMLKAGRSEAQVREAMRSAAQLFRHLRVDAAGSEKVAK